MGTITAPYNFVPLNKHVYCPDWAGQVSQDIPFSDGEDGYIEVTWRNVSPLCIRDASAERGKDNSYYSMHIKQPDGSRLYFLPGSSLRGMLRNTLNIMSFGKMVQYDDRFFGHREFDTKKPEGKKYQNKMKKAKVGWLHKVEQEDDKYVLYPCVGDLDKMRIEEVSKLYPKYDDKKTSWERNEYIKEKAGKYFPVVRTGLHLFATGQMHNAKNPQKGKQHELLIPEPNRKKAFSSIDEAVKKFFTTYEPSPDFEKYKELLDSGTDIPVSYIQEGNAVVTIGLGRMFRYPYQYGVKDLVEKEQSPDEYKDKRDLSELIFGWVDEESKSHMKGRVQIGNAFCTKTIKYKDDELQDSVGGVLGEPKPSFYPLYVKQTEGGPYKTYEDGEGIAGRKLYRIHKGNSGVKLPQGNENSSVMSHFIPIPAEHEFVMRINVHNLRKVEIGALLSAITLHENQNVYHNIGSAKGYGYGKLECLKCTLFSLKHSEEEYLKAFEQEMSNWAKEEWNKTEAVEHLLAIASEHEDDCLHMMEMDKKACAKCAANKQKQCPRMMEMDKKKSPIEKNEYLHYSKNINFSRLTENLKASRSFLTEEERRKREEILRQKGLEKSKLKFKDENKTRYEEVIRLKDEGNYAGSLQLLNSLITELNRKGLDTIEEDTLLKEIEHLQENAKKDEQEAEELKRKKDKQDMLDNGLLGYLEDTCKVKTWKVCKDRLDKKWLKARGTASLCEDDKQALENVIRRRLFLTPDKKESKEWKKPYEDSKIWKQIAEYLGDERAQNLYNELKG